jgi:hypothetical protein
VSYSLYQGITSTHLLAYFHFCCSRFWIFCCRPLERRCLDELDELREEVRGEGGVEGGWLLVHSGGSYKRFNESRRDAGNERNERCGFGLGREATSFGLSSDHHLVHCFESTTALRGQLAQLATPTDLLLTSLDSQPLALLQKNAVRSSASAAFCRLCKAWSATRSSTTHLSEYFCCFTASPELLCEVNRTFGLLDTSLAGLGARSLTYVLCTTAHHSTTLL